MNFILARPLYCFSPVMLDNNVSSALAASWHRANVINVWSITLTDFRSIELQIRSWRGQYKLRLISILKKKLCLYPKTDVVRCETVSTVWVPLLPLPLGREPPVPLPRRQKKERGDTVRMRSIAVRTTFWYSGSKCLSLKCYRKHKIVLIEFWIRCGEILKLSSEVGLTVALQSL